MNFKFTILKLIISGLITSCLSPSDSAHSCNCEYDKQTKTLIKGVNYFSDLESGKKCDQKCGFRRLLILFYNESDSSKKVLDLIETTPTLVNDINDNFAFVCLSTEGSSKNFDIQKDRFNNNKQPFFAVMTSFNDSLITSFGYMDDAKKIDSVLMKTLN